MSDMDTRATSEERAEFPSPASLGEEGQSFRNAVYVLLFIVGLGLTVWGHKTLKAATAPKPIPEHPQRIVTLAPSVTETVFSVGLGKEVAGVTSFCRYPPEVMNLPKVAGFSDVNVEAILRLRPDLVILPVDKVQTEAELTRLGLTVMPMDTRTLPGLLAAVEELGKATNHRKEADEVISRIRDAINFAQNNAKGKERPKVLFSVMHSYAGLGYISEITAAGDDGFFSYLINICGGVNAYQGALSFPTLSREAIFKLNPDVIIDLVRSEEEAAEASLGWLSLSSVSAIKNGRLHMFTDESDTVPGPRAYLTIRKTALAIHPLDETIQKVSAADAPGSPAQEPGSLAARASGPARGPDAPTTPPNGSPLAPNSSSLAPNPSSDSLAPSELVKPESAATS
jgi:iron complex transport system substrate-binding protein